MRVCVRACVCARVCVLYNNEITKKKKMHASPPASWGSRSARSSETENSLHAEAAVRGDVSVTDPVSRWWVLRGGTPDGAARQKEMENTNCGIKKNFSCSS